MKRSLAILVLALSYLFSEFVSRLGKLFPGASKRRGRVIVCVTIDNPNWFRAHIVPLAKSGYGELIVVCDEPVDELDSMTYACPPPWLARIISRAGAKFVMTLWMSIRKPADLIMGYHIFPCALICLIAARLTGARAAYQVTSGKTEIEGGGYRGENPLFKLLVSPSRFVESRAQAVSRQFDLVLVRGSSIKRYFEEFGYKGRLCTLTGSVNFGIEQNIPRDIDVVFVGRLAEIKQLHVLLDALASVQCERQLNVQIVGDGPEMTALQDQVQRLKLGDMVNFLGQQEDVYGFLERSKVFVLCSRSESVSIAMLEAMSRGVVPVTTDVGDLADFVVPGETGYLYNVGDSQALTGHLEQILTQPEDFQRISRQAREKVVPCSVDGIANFWLELLGGLPLSDQGRR